MGRVVHFEIHASDAQRATTFYSSVFGWTIRKWEGPIEYYLVSTGEGDGIDGAIVPRLGDAPAPGAAVNAYVCTIPVPSIEDAISAVERAGGKIVVAKNEIPGVGWLCYANDTEGNIFGILQPS
jgi:predicted enzyme related to lactoylglutathione lyase